MTNERKITLEIRTGNDYLERQEEICKDCMTRINTYIDRILRNNKDENNL
jgi:hypothetical protein